MSSYSNSKTVLSASELFKYRLKKDSSLPVRGGQKDFEPDGSWLQAKTLEALIQEKTNIISEPRVEKLKHLVEGVWDEKKKLVNVEKPGKFWMHMGFTDSRRNWLYPEEALFLLETNKLEIFYNGIPMSIQEAYMKILGTNVTVQEYQVFAHLRRLGYVVIRYEKERVFTNYERKIRLDQYSKKKRKKLKTEAKGLHKIPQEITAEGCHEGEKTTQENNGLTNTETAKDFASHQENPDKLETNGMGTTKNTNGKEDGAQVQKHQLSKDELTENGSEKKRICSRDEPDFSPTSMDIDRCPEPSDESFGNFYNVSSWSICFWEKSKKNEEENDIENQTLQQTALDPSADDSFPDIANKQTLTLRCSDFKLFSTDKEVVNEVVFDISDYRAKNPAAPLTKEEKNKDANEMRMKDLNFSFADWSQKKPQLEAKNWSDFKKKIKEKAAEASVSTPLDHLWNDSVTPLIKPEDATSYERILENLRIIQSASNETLLPISMSEEMKISFDVHLPDQRFKKSMPGVPNHRVCVSSADGSPPSLAVIQHLWKECKDRVPLHWAMVDSGEISFFVFNNSHPLETLY